MKNILISTVTIIGFASAAMAFEEGMDADNDGVLSQTEMLTAYPDITQETLNAVDVDGDGNISLEEWADAVANGLLG